MNFRGANNGLLLGFDIGGTKCAVVLGSDAEGQPVVLAREAFATAKTMAAEAVKPSQLATWTNQGQRTTTS